MTPALLRSWSRHRQLLGRRGTGLEQALKAVIGVYSSHPSGPLSLFARAGSFSARAFRRLDLDRLALRVPAMRRTVHLMPAAAAASAMAATLPAPDDPYWRKRYSQKGRALPGDRIRRWKSRILTLARRPLSAAEIGNMANIPDLSVKPILNLMGFEGPLLRRGADGLRSNALTYVATRSWVPGFELPAAADVAGKDDSLRWLAGEYLRAFGPARVRDFRWWAGVTAGRARRAIAAHDTVPIDDRHLVPAADLEVFESFRRPRRDTLDLLPPWDCYTMGYAPDGRARFVDPDVQDRLYGSIGATSGNAAGVVLVNGLARGAWTFRFRGAAMTVSLDLFERPAGRMKSRIESGFGEIAALLGAKDLVIESKNRGRGDRS